MFDHSPIRRGNTDRDSHDGCDLCAAYALGRDDAKAAASWAADGNTDPAHARRVLAMLEDGDPAAYDHLPAVPDLSGQWADARTPGSLFEEVTGLDAHAESTWRHDVFTGYVDQLCDAYEQGVSDTFEDACRAELAAHLPESLGVEINH